MRVRPLQAPAQPGFPPHRGGAEGFPARSSPQRRRAASPVPRGGSGGGSPQALSPAALILLLPSPWQVDFWRRRPRGDAAFPRRPPVRTGVCSYEYIHIYALYIWVCVCE